MCYYLEYNSTINCSLMFSGISSRGGRLINLPVISLPSHSSQLYFLADWIDKLFVIASSDLDFSLTSTRSPGFNAKEGMFTTSPFTRMCLCDTNWRAALR